MVVILQLYMLPRAIWKGCSYTTTRLDGTQGVVVIQTLFRSNNSCCPLYNSYGGLNNR